MKILQTADWHIGSYRGPERGGVNLRGSDILRCLAFTAETAELESPDINVVSGDVFNQAKLWADRALPETGEAIRLFRRFAKVSPVCVLKGTRNHDGDGQFQVLTEVFADGADHVYIMEKPDVLLVQTKAGPVNVAALPGFDRNEFTAKFPGVAKDEENVLFSQELSRIVLSLRAMCDDRYPSILLAHYTVQGVKMENGQISVFAQNDPVLTPETLDAAGFDLVALGHIHRPQKVASVAGNAYYSGAVNALTFNDEGQQRGFYIHEIFKEQTIVPGNNPPVPSLISRFIETPFRPFLTIRMKAPDVDDFNAGYVDDLAERLWRGKVDEKIVRVLYSCTDEADRAFSKATLEKYLMLSGAVYVSGIEPEDIAVTVSREAFQSDSAPMENLRAHFGENGYSGERIAELAELAAPMIAEATATDLAKGSGGIFGPLSLEVTNYRSYAHELFDFSAVTFCAISGPNGTGKSSLFEAINDCLYEEPREGSLTGWIRNAPDARSGAICFTFKMGDKTYRVTRTRTKSGKATLNLAEYLQGEWLNRSKERLADTQAEIIKTLGMDGKTLRSVALIMQDRYGLFLEADRETRMAILGSILGIGIYPELEEIAKREIADAERKRRSLLDEINVLTASLEDADKIREEIRSCRESIRAKQKEVEQITASADRIRLLLNSRLEAAARAETLGRRITDISLKIERARTDRRAQDDVIVQVSATLAREPEILAGVEHHNALLEQEKACIADKAAYDAKARELSAAEDEITKMDASIKKLQAERVSLTAQAKPLDERLSSEAALKAAFTHYTSERQSLTDMEAKAAQYISLSHAVAAAEKKKSDAEARFREDAATRTAKLNGLKEKARLLDGANCLDIERAQCLFLQDAQAAKAEIKPYHDQCHKWRIAQEAGISVLQIKVNDLLAKREALGYDAEKTNSQRLLVSELEKSARAYESLPGVKEQLRLIQEHIVAIDYEVDATQDGLSGKQAEKQVLQDSVDALQEANARYQSLMQEIDSAKGWLDQEKELPVARTKKENALSRVAEIDKSISEFINEIAGLQSDLAAEQKAAEGTEKYQAELARQKKDMDALQQEIQQISIRIGKLENTLEQQEATRLKILERQEMVQPVAEKVGRLEELKKAFSQDGIPHSVVKSILPRLTATANSLLGQMTGGRMGVSFVTEKALKSNAAKEVYTLDILIRELDREPMPYLSKSGGEKVKASLSIILALAEITSSRAGVQPGMLCIDEPPFLDGDGIDAYCDALETISRRYANLKIMAITHDPTMMARFPQVIEIVKDENGSHVLAA